MGLERNRRRATLATVSYTRRILASLIGAAALLALCPAMGQSPGGGIADITAILDQEKPDPARMAALSAEADASVPTDADEAALAKFYFARARARASLGRIAEAIADSEQAVNHGKGGDYVNETSRYEQFLIRVLRIAGEDDRAIKLINAQAQAFQSRSRGRLFWLNRTLALTYLGQEDIDRAQIYVRRNTALLAESKSWNDIELYRTAYLADTEAANGALLEARRRYGEAEAAYRRAQADQQDVVQNKVAKWPSAPPPEVYERDLDWLIAYEGRAKALAGRVAEAEIDLRRALLSRLGKDGKYNPDIAGILGIFAEVMIEQGRYADAEKLTRAELEIYRTIGFADGVPVVVAADEDLAQALLLQHRPEEASAVYGQIDRITAQWPQARRERTQSAARLWTLIANGHAADVVVLAEKMLEREKARSGDKSFQTAAAHGLLAAALARSARPAEAAMEFRAAVPALLSISHENDDDEGATAAARAARVRAILEAYVAFLAGNPQLGDASEEAFGLADVLRDQAVERALAAASARALAKDPALADFVRKTQDLQKQIGASLRSLNALLAAPSPQRSASSVRAAQAQIDKQRAAYADARRNLSRRFPRYGNLIDPAPARSAEIRALLRADETLLSFYFGQFDSFAWVLPKSGALKFVHLDVTLGEVEAKVARLREALDPGGGTIADIAPFDVGLAHELYAELLQPTAATWQGGKHLLVATNGALGLLPLGLLPTAPTAPAGTAVPLFADYREVPWLARTHAVTIIPSITALRTLRAQPVRGRQRSPFVGFGDPYFNVEEAADAERAAAPPLTASTAGPPLDLRAARAMTGGDLDELALLPRLPDTREELMSIALALKADPQRSLHLGRDANERTVKTLDLSKFQIISFATHGLLPGDLEGLTEPALALTAPEVAGIDGDGLIGMDDIMALKLDADWAVLSACNTGAGSDAGAEAASGLARAFFYAGTRAVLATNWTVESTSARELVTDLFRRQAADPRLTRAEALRQAMMALVDGPGVVDTSGQTVLAYAHPLFWAAYSIIGDGSGS
jgi:CHAT domain-containing protein